MKHLPNMLTLANLFCGCVAIAYILDAPAFLNTVTGEAFYPVLGLEQIYLGSIFIGIAALFDVFDGAAARMLRVTSSFGKELDSLADVVSFGVAPAMILYKLIWFSYMSEPGALDTSLWVTAPAFLLPCFGALRLARFNNQWQEQCYYFRGLPIPAVGLVVAALPLISWFPARVDVTFIFHNRWLLYGLVALLCYLMVSPIRFLKWKAAGSGLKAWWPQLVVLAVVLGGFPVLKFAILPVAFIVYVLLSLVYPFPGEEAPMAEAS